MILVPIWLLVLLLVLPVAAAAAGAWLYHRGHNRQNPVRFGKLKSPPPYVPRGANPLQERL